MKPGTKLKSVVCDTEVMVIRAGDAVVDCGGKPMAEERPAERAAIDPAFAEGTRMGKRYVDAATENGSVPEWRAGRDFDTFVTAIPDSPDRQSFDIGEEVAPMAIGDRKSGGDLACLFQCLAQLISQ